MSIQASASGLSISNDALEFRFAGADKSFAVTGIVNRIDGETSFGNVGEHKWAPNFWQLVFSQVDATGGVKKAYVSNLNNARRRSVSRESGKLTFNWGGLDLPGEGDVVDVTAVVELPAGKAASQWRIAVKNRSRRWALRETVYPCFTRLVVPGEADVLLPHENLGARLLKNFDCNTKDRRHCWGHYECPSAFPMMTAFMKNGSGIYIAAHDGEQRIKLLRHHGTGVAFHTPVENAGVLGKAADGPRYEVTVEAFKGDWWKAAAIYRKWAMAQRWTQKGPIAGRKDFPKAMAETDFWISFHLLQTVEGFSNAVMRIVKGMEGANLGLRFYRWYSGCERSDMCLNFPDNFPVRPGVKECVELFRRNGVVVMPYTNTHILDAKLELFRYARRDACRKENGDWYDEPYAGGPYGRHSFAVMCPAAKDWHATIDHFSDRVFEETGADAIYYDQVGCSAPRLCFAPEHGHALGGGTWWYEGRRAYLKRAHDKYSPRNIPVTFEGTGEAFMDVCDGHLVVTRITAEDVPFFPAVYSGYAMYFGNRQNVRGQSYDEVFTIMGREFLWGMINGWNWDWPTQDRKIDPRNGEAAKMFAVAHSRARDFLVYGSLQGDFKPSAPVAKRAFDWKMRWRGEYHEKGEMPVLPGTWWLNADKTEKALFLVNMTDGDQSARFAAPAGFGKISKRDFQNASIVRTGGEYTVKVPPRQVAIFVFGK
jgi:hypothetical protein